MAFTGAEIALCVGLLSVSAPPEGLTVNQASIIQGALSSLRASLANATENNRGKAVSFVCKLEPWQVETLYTEVSSFYQQDLDPTDSMGEIPPYLVPVLTAVVSPLIDKICGILWPDSVAVPQPETEENATGDANPEPENPDANGETLQG